jgi:N-acetylglucosamine-6-phosphate deacetylase
MEFGDSLVRRGILPSVAHSDASLPDVKEALNHGFRLVTHFLCCTSSARLTETGWRLGIVEGAYLLDDMHIELIGDGMHVAPQMLFLCYKIKGADRMILCTDSMRAAGTDVDKSILGSLRNGREVYFADGVAKLAGTKIFAASIATAEKLLKTAVLDARIPLTDAVKMLTSTPAAILGLNDRGALRPRLRADIVLFDKQMNVKTVIVGGKIIRNDIQ